MASTSTGVTGVTDVMGEASTSANKYRCEMCNIFFENESFLFSHYQSVHKIDNKYVCNTCNYTHFYLGYVRAHAREDHHSHVVNYCGVCKTYLNSLHDYKNHLNIKHKFGTMFVCDVCSKLFDQFSMLMTHYKKHHLNVHVCEMCNVSCENDVSLFLHYSEYHKKNNMYVCTKCDYKHLQFSHLKSHATIKHTYVVKYCSICDKHFYSVHEYNNHKSVHTSGTSNMFRCSLCMTVKNFSTFDYLVKHYKRMHL